MYSVIEAHKNVADSGHDLILLRNPWGRGGEWNGAFSTNDKAWDANPAVKEALSPTCVDDGLFFIPKKDFFDFFQVIECLERDLPVKSVKQSRMDFLLGLCPALTCNRPWLNDLSSFASDAANQAVSYI